MPPVYHDMVACVWTPMSWPLSVKPVNGNGGLGLQGMELDADGLDGRTEMLHLSRQTVSPDEPRVPYLAAPGPL
jgi:hypothetical protein